MASRKHAILGATGPEPSGKRRSCPKKLRVTELQASAPNRHAAHILSPTDDLAYEPFHLAQADALRIGAPSLLRCFTDLQRMEHLAVHAKAQPRMVHRPALRGDRILVGSEAVQQGVAEIGQQGCRLSCFDPRARGNGPHPRCRSSSPRASPTGLRTRADRGRTAGEEVPHASSVDVRGSPCRSSIDHRWGWPFISNPVRSRITR
jgi:hypothetical protein